MAYSGYNPDPCYKAKQHDAADLCAQWRAAIAAEEAAHEARRSTTWSIVATFLSAAAIIGLLVTIRQTKAALRIARHTANLTVIDGKRSRREGRKAAEGAEANLEEARKATRAAQESAKSGRETLNGDRAWMISSDVIAHPVAAGSNPPMHDGGVTLYMIWKNMGRSPALDVRVFSEINFRPAHRSPPPLHDCSAHLARSGAAPKGAGDDTKTFAFNVPHETWEDVRLGKKACYLYSICTYVDARTNEQRLSDVLYRVTHLGQATDAKGAPTFILRSDYIGSARLT